MWDQIDMTDVKWVVFCTQNSLPSHNMARNLPARRVKVDMMLTGLQCRPWCEREAT